jgi:bacteriorhodopsin
MVSHTQFFLGARVSLITFPDRYWSLTAVFAMCAMAFAYGLYSSEKDLVRTLCCMSAICCYTVSMQYFAMATEFGWFAIEVEFTRGYQSPTQPTRQVFWIRYLSWWVA